MGEGPSPQSPLDTHQPKVPLASPGLMQRPLQTRPRPHRHASLHNGATHSANITERAKGTWPWPLAVK